MTNEPKTTAEQRDYPPLPEPERESYRIWRGGCLFTADQMRAYYDLGRDKARAWMHLADQRAIEVAGLKVELQRLRALAASPTAQAAPAAVAVPAPNFADAYEGTREDLAIWKRRALAAERDLRAEQETSSRLAAEINANNGPSHLGEPARAAVAGSLAGWRISDPAEPDLGHWLSEEPGPSWCISEPLIAAAPQPPAEAQEPAFYVSSYELGQLASAINFMVATLRKQAGEGRVALYTHPAPQQAVPDPWPIAPDVAADLERSDWTPEEALRWYAAGKHYDTVPNGDGTSSARILDNGEVASNALRAFDHQTPAGEDPGRRLAEHVLGMDFVTDRGLRARELARKVLSQNHAASAVPTSERVREEKALRERDEAEEFIDALLDEVLGTDRPEWSSAYGRAEALQDVQERITALHAPSVDRAWGRFQSAAASGAPVQHVAYLDLGAGGYMDVGTDLSDDQLAALPKGRHMLAIVGTYGVDGFVPAAPTSEQAGATHWKFAEIEQRIKDLMAGTPYPDSTSVAQAMKQLVNELWHEYGRQVSPASGGAAPVAEGDALSDEDVRELAAIGRAVNRAAIELPQGARIQIELERDAGTVYWMDDAKGAWRHIEGSGELFSVQINAAIDAARAQAKEGGGNG